MEELNETEARRLLGRYLLEGLSSYELAESEKIEEHAVRRALLRSGVEIKDGGWCWFGEKAQKMGHRSISELFSAHWDLSMATLSKKLRSKRLSESVLTRYHGLVVGIVEATKENSRGN